MKLGVEAGIPQGGCGVGVRLEGHRAPWGTWGTSWWSLHRPPAGWSSGSADLDPTRLTAASLWPAGVGLGGLGLAGAVRPWPGPGEMHYINVNFPPSHAHSFNKLSARCCQPNSSHLVSLFSVWGNPVSLGRGRLAAAEVQLRKCR